LKANGEFIRALVAPNASLTTNGGGNSNNDFVGALMFNSVRIIGHFSFHYGGASQMPASNRMLVTSWEEIP
jgi:hypothetical protein